MGLKEIMEEIENTEDEYELKIWELIKTEGKKEVETIKVAIENKKETKEFSKNLIKIIELDKKEIKYETNKLLCYLSMKKKELK